MTTVTRAFVLKGGRHQQCSTPCSQYATCRQSAALKLSKASTIKFPITFQGKRFVASNVSSAQRNNARQARLMVDAAVVDAATKISFPEEVDGLKCLGAGVREKKIAFLGVKVYSVALYVDAEPVAAAMRESTLFNPLLECPADKLLVIKMARKVDGSQFWTALDEAVTPRIAQIATDQATAENADGDFMSEVAEAAEVREEAAIEQQELLGKFLSGSDLKEGDEIALRWRAADGTLQASRGSQTASFPSAELAQALFDVYLGSDPVSVPALQAFQSGAATL